MEKIKIEDTELIAVPAYELIVSTDERSSAVAGYYKNVLLARLSAKDAGWYGSDGSVRGVTLYLRNDGQLFNLVPLGQFKEDEEDLKARILAKLTPDEKKFLNL